jgi:hypothetical protein
MEVIFGICTDTRLEGRVSILQAQTLFSHVM